MQRYHINSVLMYRGNISSRFSWNLEASTSELLQNLKKWILFTTGIMMYGTGSNLQPHAIGLTAVKGKQ